MDQYQIIITPDAEKDLFDCKEYIADTLLSPDISLAYIRILRKAIQSLEYMPGRIAPVKEEPWHSRKVRKIISKNFYIYYLINETQKCVYILNVIYAKRDQVDALQQMNIPKN